MLLELRQFVTLDFAERVQVIAEKTLRRLRAVASSRGDLPRLRVHEVQELLLFVQWAALAREDVGNVDQVVFNGGACNADVARVSLQVQHSSMVVKRGVLHRCQVCDRHSRVVEE